MNDSILEKILGLAKPRAESVEVYFLSSQATPIEFENNRLKSLQTKAVQGVALRVIRQGRLGFASSTDLTRLEELVDAAMQTAEIGSPADFTFASHFHSWDGNDASEQAPTTAELVEVGEHLIRAVHEYNPEILVDVGFQVRSGTVKIATDQDVYAERSSQSVSASLSGNLVRGEDFLQASSYDVARNRPPDYDRSAICCKNSAGRNEPPLLPAGPILCCLRREPLPVLSDDCLAPYCRGKPSCKKPRR
jgi:PmbA protein